MPTIKQTDILTKLIERLHGSAGITALVPAASIRNHLPQVDAATAYQGLPYIRVRLDALAQYDTKSTTGYDVDAIIDCWIGPPALGDLEAHRIVDAVMDALQNQPLALTAGQCVLAQHNNTTITVEGDGRAHHAILSMRLLTSEIKGA